MSDSYFEMLKTELHKAYSVAQEARSKGLDPSDDVEVRIAKDVAARVEGIVGPPGVSEHIRSLEQGGMPREDIAFEIVRKIAAGELLNANKEFLIEQAVRTGLGILTEGVLVAPTEGIARVRVKQNPDGSDYVAVYYAGPIRSAGGTAAALSLVLADIARRECGVSEYRATDTQVMRYVEEANTYENRCVHLQYLPPEEHMRVIAENVPICIDGDPTEEIEVSAYRDVPGVETNRVRGGVPLVMCEGVALKAAKLLKYTRKLNLGWGWLEKIIKIKKKADKIEIKPDSSYLDGLVAGRPVFAYPSTKGGFRLRYGRSKTNGLMAKNIHTATMVLLDNFPAFGTHMKIERPGKGCVVSAYDGIEPPMVKLKDGRVMKVRSLEEAERVKSEVEEILFLGDMLCNYGDFLKSNHPLVPGGYCEEWWEAELASKDLSPPANRDAPSLFDFSRRHGVPLHPNLTYHWHDISAEQLKSLGAWFREGHLARDGERITQFVLPMSEAKRALEELLVEHRVHEDNVIVSGEDAYSLLSSMGSLKGGAMDFSLFDAKWDAAKQSLDIINETAGIRIKAKAPTYIGARMGRPEKAKERKMDGSPQVLFPTGSFKNRSLMKHYRTLKSREGEKTINIEVTRRRCKKCNKVCFYRVCDVCGERTEEERICQKCGRSVTTEMHCDFKTNPYDRRPVEIVDMIDSIKAKLDGAPEDLKGVKGLSNALRVPERLEKGFLRAKHDVYVFRDGTSRFDASDVTLSHFTPRDIGTSVQRLRELGYEKDYAGNPLERDDQTLVLRHQDIVLAESGAVYLMRVAAFIDDMLVNLYGLRPFYNVREKEDLIGHMAVGLSPHTSAGVLTRIIGFTKANVGYGHPYFHTAKRRNCFHAEEKMLVYDGEKFEHLTIKDLVDRHLIGQTDHDGFGTEYKEIKGIKTFAFNMLTNRFELADVTHVSKHPAPDRLISLKTKSGRRIRTTPEHPFPDGDSSDQHASAASEVLSPWTITDRPIHDIDSIDLMDATNPSEAMIRTEDEVLPKGKSYPELSRESGIPYKSLTNYIYRKSYPLALIRKYNPQMLHGRRFRLGSRRDKVSVKPTIEVNGDFCSLLGFYLAEGFMKKNQKDTHQVTITASKKWAKSYLKDNIYRLFGIMPCISGCSVTMCSRFIHGLFEHLQVGQDARSKRIPDFIFGLPDEKIRAFLKGYFSGDGSCSLSSTLEVNVTSVNKWLIDGVSTLLTFQGIRHSIKEDNRMIRSDLILKFYGKPKALRSFKIRIYGDEARKYLESIGFIGEKHRHALNMLRKWKEKRRSGRASLRGEAFVDKVMERKLIDCPDRHVYDVTVDKHHTLICSGIVTRNCDGDEDSVMLLLDALINFSRKYLDERRGGTMDAPLVLTMAVNPKEVDDEAYCMEMVSRYPLEFYEAAERNTPPYEVKIKTVNDVLGTEEQFEIPFTHGGGSLDVGNIRTAYVTLESIPEKIDVQFRLQERLRAVDIKDAAERLILSHFIPDLYGNLRSFSRQTFRCVSCNTIYRRVPLAGKCSRCGGNLLLTINKGGIEKYLQISRDIVDRYGLPPYLRQRLDLLEKEIKSIFEDDKIKQTGLSDFL